MSEDFNVTKVIFLGKSKPEEFFNGWGFMQNTFGVGAERRERKMH